MGGGEGIVRNSSSGGERGIAGPKVTGSNPVCSFFYPFYNKYNAELHPSATGSFTVAGHPRTKGSTNRIATAPVQTAGQFNSWRELHRNNHPPFLTQTTSLSPSYLR